MYRRASSFKAAHYLERSSTLGLNNYFGLVAHDSDYSFFDDEDEDQDPATMSTQQNELTKVTSHSMLRAVGATSAGAGNSSSDMSPLIRHCSSFVF